MRQINYDELRTVQIDILQYIHDFCVKNEIKYSLAYGTLLGAVRHKGYIPWDDDIDIAMLREDYEKFLNAFNGTSDNYQVYECRINPDYNVGFAKVCDNRTLILERANTKKIGVFVDVFPIDDLCETYDESVKLFNKYKRVRLAFQIKGRLVKDVKGWWKKVLMVGLKIVFTFYDINKHLKNANKDLSKYHNPKSKYVGLVVDGNLNEIVEREVWSSFGVVSFESREFMAVNETDKYLKHSYGNYMKLPPIEQQVPKHDFDSVFWKE